MGAARKLTEHQYGERLFTLEKGYRRGLLRRVEDRLFEEMLADERLKRQMIGFMDAVSALNDPHTIAELIHAYFPKEDTDFTGLLGLFLKMEQQAWLSDRMESWGIKAALELIARRFLTGHSVEEALERVTHLQNAGLLSSVDVVREEVISREEADDYLARVLKVMHLWGRAQSGTARTEGDVPRRHLSIKLSALSHRFDPMLPNFVLQEAGGRLLQIFQEARQYAADGQPILINVDLEEYLVRDLSYEVFWQALSDDRLEAWDEAGLVIQSYFKDAESALLENIKRAVHYKKRIQVRIVKGAYHKYEQIDALRRGWPIPVLLDQTETDKNFRHLIEIALMNQQWIRLATGTHNLGDISFSQVVGIRQATSPFPVEAQFLFGIGEALATACQKEGIISRLYGPFGATHEAIGYLVRRLAEVGPDSAIGKTYVVGSFDQYREKETPHPYERGEVPLGSPQILGPRFPLVPETDFSKRSVREGMAHAIEKSLTSSQRREPIHKASNEEIDRVINMAQDGFKEWSSRRARERAQVLRRAANLVIERQYILAALIIAEARKPWAAALDETREAANFLHAYALDAEREATHYEPRGVGVAISPFNYPLAILMGQLASGLALGNAMIAKSAEQTPLCGQHAVEILREAGIPVNALHFLPGSGEEVGQRLVESPFVDFVAFTGSVETARQILKTAAAHPPKRGGIKRVVAETGGKNALIVDETADLDVAVHAIVKGAFEFNGQRCSATSRVIVVDTLYQQLMERLIPAVDSVVIGDPHDSATELGELIDQTAVEKAQHYIKIGQQEAKLIHATEGGPHIFTEVDPHARIAQEEIFAPILAVIRASSFDKALMIANDSSYALTAALISRHPKHIKKFLVEMEAGNKYVNRPQIGARPWEAPFGGFKNSGTGPKAGGRHLVARFGRPKRKSWQAISLPSLQEEQAPLEETERFKKTLDELRNSQKTWARSSLEERLAFLKQMQANLYEWTRNTDSDSLARNEGERAIELITDYMLRLPQFLLPHETIGLPGERNEVLHDRPLGIGLIWHMEERFSDRIAALAAAVAMGNCVKFFAAGDELASFDFLVAHGPHAQDLYKSLISDPTSSNIEHIGFPRLIGEFDDPSEPRYLTYFAHETTRTECTLRHGADLDLDERIY